MSDFQVVKSKKHKRKKFNIQNKSEVKESEDDKTIDVDKYERKLKDTLCCLKSSAFYSDIKDLLSGLETEEIVCYGIGNFADCCIARYQLALILLLREDHFKVPKTNCHFYDPKFHQEEQLFLRNSGFTVILENEEGKRRAEKKTLFYMPHCGKSLYNNLIWANWSMTDLSHCTVIGNSFSNIIQRNPKRLLDETCWYLLNIEPFTTEQTLPENFQYTDIFNDTTVLTFPEVKLQEVTSQMWRHTDEPVYNEEDIEFIPNK